VTLEKKTRGAKVQRVLVVVLLGNILVTIAEAILGILVGSLAIAADAIHSAVDCTNNIIGLMVVRASDAPPDEKHPFGHRKFETMAAFGIGIAILLVAGHLLSTAWEAFWTGAREVVQSELGFAVLAGTAIANIAVALYEARKAKELESPLLLADASHTAADVLVKVFVAASYIGTYFDLSWADPVGAVIVTAVIVRVAWGILRPNLSTLVGAAQIDPSAIVDVAMAIPGVTSCHRVRSHGTPDAVHVDLHLVCAGEPTLREAHELSHRVEAAIHEALPRVSSVTVHPEPRDDPDEPL